MGKKLKGVIPAPLTPLTEQGKVDFGLLQKQVSWFLQAGVDGLFIGGTTGEGAYLSTAEKRDIFSAVREVAAGKVMLCLACIQPSTPQVLEELEALEKLGPDFMVAVTPYYYDMPQEAIRSHFVQIAGRSPAPLIIYNIPQCTRNPVSVETVLELANTPNITGSRTARGTSCRSRGACWGPCPRAFPGSWARTRWTGRPSWPGRTGSSAGFPTCG